MPITNATMTSYTFLDEMMRDSYFPNDIVEMGVDALIHLCEEIERLDPSLQDAYRLTHATTERFNALGELLEERGSEIETAARECIAADIDAILTAYGYEDIDLEEAIAPRDW